jgi:DNA gyrase subunit A
MGRATQGVRLINLKGNDEIASVAKIEHEDEEVEEALELGLDGESVVVTDAVAAEEVVTEGEEAEETEEEEEEAEEEDDDTEEEEEN